MAEFAMFEDDELDAINRNMKKFNKLSVLSAIDLESESESESENNIKNNNVDIPTNDNIYEFYEQYKINKEKMMLYDEFIENITCDSCVTILNQNTEQYPDHQVTNDIYHELMANISQMSQNHNIILNFNVLIQLLTRKDYDCLQTHNLEEFLVNMTITQLSILDYTVEQFKIILSKINWTLVNEYVITKFINSCNYYESHKTVLAPLFLDLLMQKHDPHNNINVFQRNFDYAVKKKQLKLMSIEDQKKLKINDIIEVYNNIIIPFGGGMNQPQWISVKIVNTSVNSVTIIESNFIPNEKQIYFTDMKIAKAGTFTNGKLHINKTNCKCSTCDLHKQMHNGVATPAPINLGGGNIFGGYTDLNTGYEMMGHMGGKSSFPSYNNSQMLKNKSFAESLKYKNNNDDNMSAKGSVNGNDIDYDLEEHEIDVPIQQIVTREIDLPHTSLNGIITMLKQTIQEPVTIMVKQKVFQQVPKKLIGDKFKTNSNSKTVYVKDMIQRFDDDTGQLITEEIEVPCLVGEDLYEQDLQNYVSKKQSDSKGTPFFGYK